MIDWEGIVKDHGPAVWRTVFRLLANHADADDCFQETFADALQRTRDHPQVVRHWRALLVRLATARGIDRLRQRIRSSTREVPGADINGFPDHQQPRPEDRIQQAEMSARLRRALAHLPPKQADAFCLHALEGWTYREVAEHLDESVDAVGVLIHRARATLRERIGFILSNSPRGAESRNQLSRPSEIDEVSHEQ